MILKTVKTLLLSLLIANQAYGAISPENTTFAFDLHGVCVELQLKNALKSFGKVKNKREFCKQILRYLFTNKKKRKNIEAMVLQNQADEETILGLINPHQPIQGTLEIIQELKKMGYKIYLCSNLGEKSYLHMSKAYPELFNLFDNYYISNPAHGYIKKNDPMFFKYAVEKIEASCDFHPSQIVFIDDSGDNLKTAQQADARFTTILFKNPTQLREELAHLNALPLASSQTMLLFN